MPPMGVPTTGLPQIIGSNTTVGAGSSQTEGTTPKRQRRHAVMIAGWGRLCSTVTPEGNCAGSALPGRPISTSGHGEVRLCIGPQQYIYPFILYEVAHEKDEGDTGQQRQLRVALIRCLGEVVGDEVGDDRVGDAPSDPVDSPQAVARLTAKK